MKHGLAERLHLVYEATRNKCRKFKNPVVQGTCMAGAKALHITCYLLRMVKPPNPTNMD